MEAILKSTEERVSLDIIEVYVNAFKYLMENKNTFKKQYTYADWIDNCITEIWKIINIHDTEWMLGTDNTAKNRAVLLWSWLYFYKKKMNCGNDINDDFFRLLRFFYVRYNNNNLSVKSLTKTVDFIIDNGIWKDSDNGLEEFFDTDDITERKFKTKEEVEKYLFLQQNQTSIRELESLIWKIEDHPLNIDGRGNAKKGEGHANCSYLIEFDKKPSIQNLSDIQTKFYELFPIKENKVDESNCKKLVSILLFYDGEFWDRTSPWYYHNYEFCNWKKIIRGDVFKLFFNDYKEKTLDDLYKEKVIEFDCDMNTDDLKKQLQWYASKLRKKDMWREGFYIVKEHGNYEPEDANFCESSEILNTRGDFKGGNPQILSELVDNI